MSSPSALLWRRGLPFNELALLVAILVVVLITAGVDSNHSYVRDPYTSVRDIARNVALLGIFGSRDE